MDGRGFWTRHGLWLAAVMVAVLVYAGLDPNGLMGRAGEAIHDSYQRIAAQRTVDRAPSDRVTLIEIDRASLADVGPWPWPRTLLAALVERASQAGAAAIVLAMPLDTPDPTSPEQASRFLGGALPGISPLGGATAFATTLSHDSLLARALAQAPAVLALSPAQHEADAVHGGGDGGWPGLLLKTEAGLPALTMVPNLAGPVPVLSDAASQYGIDAARLDGGVARRLALLLDTDDGAAISLALGAVSHVAGGSAAMLSSNGPFGAGEGAAGGWLRDYFIEVDGFRTPITKNGDLLLDAGRAPAPRRLQASTALRRGTALDVENHVVVIGLGADIDAVKRSSPLGVPLSPAGVTAQAIAQILAGQTLTRPAWANGAEIIAALLLGVLVLLAVRFGLIWGLFTVLAGGGAALYGGWHLYMENALVMHPAAPMALAVAALVAGAAAHGLDNRMNAFRRRAALDGKLPLVAPGRLPGNVMAGQLRKVTFLSCEIREFDQIAELYRNSPEDLQRLIVEFHTAVASRIRGFGGTIDRTDGHRISAFWGAPYEDENHALRACDCASRIINDLEKINEAIETRFKSHSRPYSHIHLGIGINTGHAVIGNLGYDARYDYTGAGNAADLAAHLRRYSEIYGPAIIVGEHTYNAARARYALLEIDRIAIEGRGYAIGVYAVLGNPVVKASPRFRALEQAHEAIMQAYRAQQWDKTRALLRETRKLNGAIPQLYDLYEKRIAYYEANPPGGDWDGSFRPVLY